jgi:hypothetical protein
MANKADKPVAKSLHTITVIVQVARLHMGNLKGGDIKDVSIAKAMETLGLAGRADPYGLAAIARKQLG